ncbi:ATP-dependent DNA helicase [Micromonospora sp. KC207]|nr:ATP-dependent DNA helicase [Micromonospora sp. KC207]
MDVEPNEQIAAEQSHVSAMYQRLDAEVAAVRTEQAALDAVPPAERPAVAAMLAGRLAGLESAEPGLCFGRIDRTGAQPLHVGRRGLWADGEPLLVDWRAEAARPFYTATPAHPMGLRRRRHLRLDGRTVVGIADELLDGSPPRAGDVVGDGPLAEALSAPRTGRMRDAVTTLQAEQDAVIRAPGRGVTVVQGGPGTGKTVVALHRAAYVLFAYPPAARGVLVVGPDARFLDYISQVLPSLGEHDVRLVARAEIGGSGPVAAEPLDVARRKGRATLAAEMATLVRARRPAATAATLPAGPDRITLDAAAVGDALAAAAGLPHNPGRAAFRERLADHAAQARVRAVREQLDRCDAEAAVATGVDLDEAVAADLRSLGLAGVPAVTVRLVDPAAARADLRACPALDSAVTSLWPPLSAEEAVEDLLAAHPELGREPGAPWTAADLALLDEARELLDGPPGEVYGHVVVDEAQELTEMDWRAVLRRCPSRSMTVVGDFAQAGPVSTVSGWTEALGTRITVHTLTVNYRTTAEILEASRDLLAEIAPEQPPSRSLRHGEPPRVLTGATVADELRPGELTAVICADADAARLAAELGDRARVLPVSRARGLEFDAVVVVDPDRIKAARPSGKRDLYVALTRATRRVTVIGSERA